MSKYKLINNQTKEEHLCNKVTIDGFDYYVSSDKNYQEFEGWFYHPFINELQINCNPDGCHKVIATNNLDLDIPKVVDEVDNLANKHCDTIIPKDVTRSLHYSFKCGYNKSQETYPFSEEDMIDFILWKDENKFSVISTKEDWVSELLEYSGCVYTTKELLQLWKEQKLKIVYYNG